MRHAWPVIDAASPLPSPSGSHEPHPGETPENYWDRRYAEQPQMWSGRPNSTFVLVAASLDPGRALELGCGEGADAIWLAQQGWHVTAYDHSTEGLQHARAAATTAGILPNQLHLGRVDLTTWEPREQYDLVLANYLHSPVDLPRYDILRRAAQAVAPGGHLLLVSHAMKPPWAKHGHGHEDRLLKPAEELDELGLDAAEWTTKLAHVHSRAGKGPDGALATLDDGIVLLLRHGGRPA